MSHSQRLKDFLAGKDRERFAGDSFNNQTQHKIIGVAIKILIARKEIEFVLTKNNVEINLLRLNIKRRPKPGKSQEFTSVFQTAGLMQQVFDRNLVSIVGKFRYIFMDIIIERKLSLLFKQQYSSSGKLFRNGTRFYNRIIVKWYSMFQIRHSPCMRKNNLAVATDG